MSYFPLTGAYGAANLQNTPSQYENMKYPCFSSYFGGEALMSPTLDTNNPSVIWNNSNLSMAASYQFPVPVPQSPYALRGNVPSNLNPRES